jgi:hypothetical protein
VSYRAFRSLSENLVYDPATANMDHPFLPEMSEYIPVGAAGLFQSITQCGQEQGGKTGT